jgi:hypothetical protein
MASSLSRLIRLAEQRSHARARADSLEHDVRYVHNRYLAIDGRDPDHHPALVIRHPARDTGVRVLKGTKQIHLKRLQASGIAPRNGRILFVRRSELDTKSGFEHDTVFWDGVGLSVRDFCNDTRSLDNLSRYPDIQERIRHFRKRNSIV